jgi:hypothetical protein
MSTVQSSAQESSDNEEIIAEVKIHHNTPIFVVNRNEKSPEELAEIFRIIALREFDAEGDFTIDWISIFGRDQGKGDKPHAYIIFHENAINKWFIEEDEHEYICNEDTDEAEALNFKTIGVKGLTPTPEEEDCKLCYTCIPTTFEEDSEARDFIGGILDDIADVKTVYLPATWRQKGVAFIEFHDASSASIVLRVAKQVESHGHTMYGSFARKLKPRESPPSPAKSPSPKPSGVRNTPPKSPKPTGARNTPPPVKPKSRSKESSGK